MINSVLVAFFPLLMAFSAAYDLLTMRIPNWISVSLALAFVVFAFVIGIPLQEIGIHFAVGLAVLVAAFLLFIPGWIGGGDAKLAAAIGLWMGPEFAIPFLVYSSFLGGILTVVLLVFRSKIPLAWLPKKAWILRLHDKSVGAPYGIALAIGAMLIYVDTPLFSALAAAG